MVIVSYHHFPLFSQYFQVFSLKRCYNAGEWCILSLLRGLVGWLHRGLTPLQQLSHIMAVGDAYVFPGFVKPALTQLFCPKPPTTSLTCFLTERNKDLSTINCNLVVV